MPRSLEATGQSVALLVMFRATSKNVRYVSAWRVLKAFGILFDRDNEWRWTEMKHRSVLDLPRVLPPRTINTSSNAPR
jgi:hypothetical protein